MDSFVTKYLRNTHTMILSYRHEIAHCSFKQSHFVTKFKGMNKYSSEIQCTLKWNHCRNCAEIMCKFKAILYLLYQSQTELNFSADPENPLRQKARKKGGKIRLSTNSKNAPKQLRGNINNFETFCPKEHIP